MSDDQTRLSEMNSPLSASLLAAGTVVASALVVVGDKRQQAWRLPVDCNDSPAVSGLSFQVLENRSP